KTLAAFTAPAQLRWSPGPFTESSSSWTFPLRVASVSLRGALLRFRGGQWLSLYFVQAAGLRTPRVGAFVA
ncbi:MAG: hypothetical protein ACM3ZE_04045, partial [Myxococcales bacterium]